MNQCFPVALKMLLLCALGYVCLGAPASSVAQRKTPPDITSASEQRDRPAVTVTTNSEKTERRDVLPARSWKAHVSAKPPYFITLRATDAPLADVAAEISRKIKAPIQLSSVMQRQLLNLSLEQAPFETAARAMAPQVFVDYLVSGAPGTTPAIVAVYLFSFNENPPAESIATKNSSESFIISGDTEEGIESENTKAEKAKEELPLYVGFENNQLSVRARKQPLIAVLYEVASKLGIPVDIQDETSEVIDIDIKSYSVEDAVRALSPLVNLYSRTNLQTLETRPLRIVLSASQKSKMVEN